MRKKELIRFLFKSRFGEKQDLEYNIKNLDKIEIKKFFKN